jgi:hypothetical protein
MWMTKNQKLLPSAFQNAADQRGIEEQGAEVGEPDKDLRIVVDIA